MEAHDSVETLPNGMLVPQYYGVWHGQWYVAKERRRTFMLYAYDSDAPGPEWSPSRTDESGRPQDWRLEVAKEALDRLIKVTVTAKWRGFVVSLGRYHNGLVEARVGGDPDQEAKAGRGEIPEIVMVGRGEYVGTFRWEDLEDIQMVEKDLKK